MLSRMYVTLLSIATASCSLRYHINEIQSYPGHVRRLSSHTQRGLAALPPSETLPIIIELGSESAVPILAHLQHIPLFIIGMPHQSTEDAHISKPSAVLLLLGKPTWHLDMLIFHLISSHVWDIEAAVIVIHGDEFGTWDGIATQSAANGGIDIMLALGVAWKGVDYYYVLYRTDVRKKYAPETVVAESYNLSLWATLDYSRYTARFAVTQWLPESVTECCDKASCATYGPDALLAKTARHYLGSKVKCVRDDLGPGKRLPNGSFSENLGLVASRRADVLAVGLLWEPGWRDRVAFIYPHAQDDFCLLLSNAPHVSFHQSMGMALGRGVWIALGAALATAALARAAFGLSALDATFGALRSAVTGAIDRPGVGFRRQLVGACLSAGCCVVLGGAFAGTLASALTAPRRQPQVDTLAGALAAVSRVHVVPAYAQRFDDLPRGDAVRELARRFLPTDWNWQWNNAMKQVLAGEPTALLMTRSELRFMSAQKNFTAEGHRQAHVAKECVLAPAFIALPVRAQWPLARRLSRLVQRTVQMGLYHKFLEVSMPHYSRYHQVLRLLPGDPPWRPFPLMMSHLRGPFLALMLGQGVAAAAFAAELVVRGLRRLQQYQLVLRNPIPQHG